MTFLIEIAWKGSILLAATCAVAVLLRRASASLRHFVWTAAFASLLFLAPATVLAPKWGVSLRSLAATASHPDVRAATSQTTVRVLGSSRQPRAAFPSTPTILLFLWIAGCLVAGGRFLVGTVRTSWMVRRASPAAYAHTTLGDLAHSLGLGPNVRVLESELAPMPLTWGIVRPVVVLPEGASAWPPPRLRTVLLHELVHVRRRDLLAQVLGRAACCLYWFHPLAWVGLAQLRKERERACDDGVLRGGIAAPDYAGHLLDLVRALAAKRSPWSEALAMADSSDLESRVRALLDRQRDRRPVSRRAAFAIAATVIAALAPLAVITVHAQAGTSVLAGTASDPSGARIPNCRVTAKNLDGPNQEVAVANEAGEYRFTSLPAGRYSVEFGSAGFALAKTQAILQPGVATRVDGRLELGSVNESMVIRGHKPSAIPSVRPAGAAQRIKVGGMVTPVRLIKKTNPVYPPDLQQQGVEGAVVISAVISTSGTVLNPTVRNTVDRRLAAAAIDAVKDWIYQPALLNGEPVETATTITLEFQLGQ